MSLRTWLRANLPRSRYRRLVRMAWAVLCVWHRNDLNRLASSLGTDKWGEHWYTQYYQRYFEPLKNKRLNVLVIGIGGYDAPDAGGKSLRMWKAYFRKSQINGSDIYDNNNLSERRIDIR
ncbi:MAG: hypothetical protein WB795_19795 [Candidatus Acidiferrales bacterium]